MLPSFSTLSTRYVHTTALALPPLYTNRSQFVRVHQDLLNILIGKSGILTKVPLIGPPVATVLRQVEGVVDVSTYLLSPALHQVYYYYLVSSSPRHVNKWH